MTREQADGEYISKLDMIDWLKDIRHKMKPQNYHTASEFEIAENQIWNLIQMLQMGALPTVAIPSAEPKWIPVSERLPEDEEDVLFCAFGHIMLGYHPRDWKSTHFAERGSWELQKNVEAWMPLPKPYEPQESEG